MSPLEPKSIAVIGASNDEQKIGHLILKNLIEQGYAGKILPINPKGGMILNRDVHTSVTDSKETIDMAVIVTPARTVIDLAKECGKKKINTLVVISAGFKETGKEGERLERELKSICDQYDMKLIGPNCLGVIRPSTKMNASFAKDMPQDGSIALLSQSGALAVAIMDMASQRYLGFSMMVSMGNKARMNECDFLEIAENDPKTKTIGLYVESISDGLRFRDIASRVSQKKPIVMIKAGSSEHGSHAVSSHTGALAGSDSAIDALCLQTGIVRAKTYDEFLDFLAVLDSEPQLQSNNIAIITNAGGPGILATDAGEKHGLMLPALSEKNQKALKKLLPPAASVLNPIDVLGDSAADRYASAIDTAANDPSIDGIVVIATPQVMTPMDEIAKAIIKEKKEHRLIPMVTSFVGHDSVLSGIEILQKNGTPNFRSPETAVRALGALKKRTINDVAFVSDERKDDRSSEAHEMLKDIEGAVDDETVAELFALYDLPMPQQAIAQDEKEAITLANEIGYPVIMKISSPDILHKSDVGGVKANIKNEKDVKAAWKSISENVAKHKPTAGINGILVQKFLPVGHEFIVGGISDPAIGPMVMVGLGGIYTELLKDTAFRLAPLSEKDAYEMIESLKSWKLLLGMRGGARLNIDGLAKTIMTLADMLVDVPSIAEIDINPVLVGEKDVIIADAKVVMQKKKFDIRKQ